MATLIDNPSTPMTMRDVAAISRQLADDISRVVLKTEGFSVDDYLSLDGPYFVELANGRLKVLPMPDAFHQALAFVFASLMLAWSKPDALARTKLAPFRVAISEREFREPDVCFMHGIHSNRRHATYWEGADLVVEIVSESNRNHDLVTKRAEYAAAGIPEYWIIDPANRSVLVLALAGKEYAVHGEFHFGHLATSATLVGLSVEVTKLFQTAESQA